MWEEDPAEYIRIRFDIFDDFLSPVSAAESLLQVLAVVGIMRLFDYLSVSYADLMFMS